MSDNTPQGTPDVPPAPAAPTAAQPVAGQYAPPAQPGYPTPPAYPQQPSAYPQPGYAAPPQAPAQPYAYGQQAPYGAYPYTAGPKTNGLAITSLVSSIAAFVVLPFIASIVGVITGHIALKQLRTSGENGRGLALAGVIVGWVGVGLGLLFILFVTIAIVAGINAGSSYSTYS